MSKKSRLKKIPTENDVDNEEWQVRNQDVKGGRNE